MSQAAQPLDLGARVVGVPRIDRYFPECRIAAIEAVSRFRFGIEDFGRIYGRHTFSYSKPAGPIVFRDNGVELDLNIHREPLGPRELDDLIEDIYGVRIEIVRFDELSKYRRFCEESIARGVPVVSNFDLGFIKQRREYGKLRTGHVIVLLGYDTGGGSWQAGEQMLGELTIDRSDFEACFEHRVVTDGAMMVWTLERGRDGGRDLSAEEVSARIRGNIENLTSSNESTGLAGLARFHADLTAYLQSAEFGGKPFAVPGLWVFSHERHIQRKWLAAVRGSFPSAAVVDDLDSLLGSLFKRWLAADYLLEKCLMSGDGRALRGLASHLNEILREERLTLAAWQGLSKML
jgi:hypothetical protein